MLRDALLTGTQQRAETMEISINPNDMAQELGDAANAPIGPCVGIAAIALNMAIKYHDATTIQDGVLYQQYKMEGRDFTTIGLADVFDTAIKIETHLVNSNKRVAAAVIAALIEDDAGEVEPPVDAPAQTEPTSEG